LSFVNYFGCGKSKVAQVLFIDMMYCEQVFNFFRLSFNLLLGLLQFFFLSFGGATNDSQNLWV
jgi:hypothetical protein